MPTPTTRPRIKGLQDIRRSTQQSQLDVLNQLVQLQREKERITQEKQHWQAKVTRIDARLEEIVAQEHTLHACRAVGEGAGEARAAPEERWREVRVRQERAPAEAVHTVTMRY